MTALLYISHSSKLSKDDILIIDQQVFKRKKRIHNIAKSCFSIKSKIKKIIIIIYIRQGIFSNSRCHAMGFCVPSPTTWRSRNSDEL